VTKTTKRRVQFIKYDKVNNDESCMASNARIAVSFGYKVKVVSGIKLQSDVYYDHE